MKKLTILLLSSVFVSMCLFSSGCEKIDNISLNTKEKEKKIALSKEKSNIVDLFLYFDTSKDSTNLEIAKEERVIKKDELLGETIILELIKGPALKSDLKPVLPKETRLLSFSIKDDVAFVNLSKESNVFMSPSKELICLKSIVWSLTEIESIHKVKIMIENKDSNIWGGHYDLTKAMGRDDLNDGKKK